MQTILWQDWITVSSAASSVDIIQSEPAWLDADAVEDLVFWLDIRECDHAASVLLKYESAPAKDEALFTPIVLPAIDLSTLSIGAPTVTPALSQNAVAPASRWVRWRIGSTAAWSATFRIWVAGSGARL